MNRRPSQSRSDYDSFSPERLQRFKASSPDMYFFEKRRKKPFLLRFLRFLFFILLAVFLVNLLVNQFVWVSHVSVPITGLTEDFEGYTLLQISDLKGALFGPDQLLLRYALQNEAYDAVVLTGDMVSQLGNAQPLYALIAILRDLNSTVPIYFIAGDSDPVPTSMDYAAGGSPFAPWVLGAQQRSAQLLSAPQPVTRGTQTLWLATSAQLNLDLNTMQQQYELQYLSALNHGDENEIELATYNLHWLEDTRIAREQMQESDICIMLTHVPPDAEELENAAMGSLWGRASLVLSGHYLGGLIRLPLLGALFIPSQTEPLYGLFPGSGTTFGLSRQTHAWVYSSPGLGSSDSLYPSFFTRFFNPPTVTLLSLTPSRL